jgi:hypothetical protein
MSSLAERDLGRKVERLLFGSPVPPAFSWEEAGEERLRLLRVGIRSWLIPVLGCVGRWEVGILNPYDPESLLRLSSAGEVASILRGNAHLPIRALIYPGPIGRRRRAELRGQSHFLGAEGGW